MKSINYGITKNTLCIFSSYKYAKVIMVAVLQEIRCENRDSLVWKRTMKSLYDEWCVHNACYKLHILRSHTAYMELNYPNRFEWAYRLAAPVARLLIR